MIRRRFLFCSVYNHPIQCVKFSESNQLQHEKKKIDIQKLHAFSIDKTIQASRKGTVSYINCVASYLVGGLSLQKLKLMPFTARNVQSGVLQNINYSGIYSRLFVQFNKEKFGVFDTRSTKMVFSRSSGITCIHSSEFLFEEKYLCLGYSSGKMLVLDIAKRNLRSFDHKIPDLSILTLSSYYKPKEKKVILVVGTWSVEMFHVFEFDEKFILALPSVE